MTHRKDIIRELKKEPLTRNELAVRLNTSPVMIRKTLSEPNMRNVVEEIPDGIKCNNLKLRLTENAQ